MDIESVAHMDVSPERIDEVLRAERAAARIARDLRRPVSLDTIARALESAFGVSDSDSDSDLDFDSKCSMETLRRLVARWMDPGCREGLKASPASSDAAMRVSRARTRAAAQTRFMDIPELVGQALGFVNVSNNGTPEALAHREVRVTITVGIPGVDAAHVRFTLVDGFKRLDVPATACTLLSGNTTSEALARGGAPRRVVFLECWYPDYTDSLDVDATMCVVPITTSKSPVFEFDTPEFKALRFAPFVNVNEIRGSRFGTMHFIKNRHQFARHLRDALGLVVAPRRADPAHVFRADFTDVPPHVVEIWAPRRVIRGNDIKLNATVENMPDAKSIDWFCSAFRLKHWIPAANCPGPRKAVSSLASPSSPASVTGTDLWHAARVAPGRGDGAGYTPPALVSLGFDACIRVSHVPLSNLLSQIAALVPDIEELHFLETPLASRAPARGLRDPGFVETQTRELRDIWDASKKLRNLRVFRFTAGNSLARTLHSVVDLVGDCLAACTTLREVTILQNEGAGVLFYHISPTSVRALAARNPRLHTLRLAVDAPASPIRSDVFAAMALVRNEMLAEVGLDLAALADESAPGVETLRELRVVEAQVYGSVNPLAIKCMLPIARWLDLNTKSSSPPLPRPPPLEEIAITLHPTVDSVHRTLTRSTSLTFGVVLDGMIQACDERLSVLRRQIPTLQRVFLGEHRGQTMSTLVSSPIVVRKTDMVSLVHLMGPSMSALRLPVPSRAGFYIPHGTVDAARADVDHPGNLLREKMSGAHWLSLDVTAQHLWDRALRVLGDQLFLRTLVLNIHDTVDTRPLMNKDDLVVCKHPDAPVPKSEEQVEFADAVCKLPMLAALRIRVNSWRFLKPLLGRMAGDAHRWDGRVLSLQDVHFRSPVEIGQCLSLALRLPRLEAFELVKCTCAKIAPLGDILDKVIRAHAGRVGVRVFNLHVNEARSTPVGPVQQMPPMETSVLGGNPFLTLREGTLAQEACDKAGIDLCRTACSHIHIDPFNAPWLRFGSAADEKDFARLSRVFDAPNAHALSARDQTLVLEL